MGMITRVRARLQSVNTPTKIDPRIQDEKTAQTGEKIISTAVRYCNYSCPFGTTRSAWLAYKLSLRPVWSSFTSLTCKPLYLLPALTLKRTTLLIQCIYVFRVKFKTSSNRFLNLVNNLVFAMVTPCESTGFLYII